MAQKYPARPHSVEEEFHVKLGPDSSNQEDKVKIYTDGTLEAVNIKEISTDGLSYELNEKRDNFNLRYDLDKSTSVKFVPKYVDKVYSTTVTKSFSIKNAFAVYRNDVKKFVTKNLTRYKTSSKALRKEIDKVLKNKNEYLFTERRGDKLWNQVYIDSTTFGPYNYDVNLSATKDINFINDLLVIRTGSGRHFYDRSAKQNVFVAGQSNVLWVSPHDTFDFSGEGAYVNSGEETVSRIAESGLYSGYTFYGKNLGVTNNYSSYSLSSKYATILKDTTFTSDLSYKYITDVSDTSKNGQPIGQTPFYSVFVEYGNNSHTGVWDGVIPSGNFIEIQTWSSNPKYVGFNGEISIKPVTSSLADDVDISCDITCTAEDADYQTSIKKAVDKAKRKFYKKINMHLIKTGVKSKPSKYKRYEKLLERVAQDVYAGLGFIRNENVAKIQGLETNPLNSPMYYDGTSLEYGGSNTNLNYSGTSQLSPLLKTKVTSDNTTY
tara:strand:- start:1501 stop:2976 length:1476 start_codon:yes stop_codon:yes gene_type:complete